MVSRETLERMIEDLPEDEVASLLARLRDRVSRGPTERVLELEHVPSLADVWDNDEDAIYDQIDAR